MPKLKVAIVSAGEGASTAFRVLKEMEQKVEIVGLAELTGDFSWLKHSERGKVFATKDLVKLLSMRDIDTVIDISNLEEVKQQINNLKPPHAEIIEVRPGGFLAAILRSKEELLDAKRLKGELWAILNSVQDAIEVADNTGLIKYVNPAFTRVTGIPEKERVGKNIFEVSPDGALAQCLIKQTPITGYRTTVGGSEVEVISHAAPIVIDGEIEGAVVVFQAVTDILKLMDELQKSTVIIENLYTRINQITSTKCTFDDLIGTSKIFNATLEMARKAAKSDVPVMITGESGTGKELYAQAIHHGSNRRDKPFIKIDCSAIPESLLEMELFGYEKGSFSGASRTKLGSVELANNGTLFLDSLGGINKYVQEKLVRLIREGEFRRVGGERPVKVDVRFITATSYDLKDLIRKGRFREDLYLLLNVFEINIPPLRQRIEDIPPLVEHLIERYNRKFGKHVQGISPEALQLLSNYDWPGNVRELESVIEHAMVAVDGNQIAVGHLSPYIRKFTSIGTQPYTEIIPLDKMEQMMLKMALARFGETLEGKKKAAQALNISLATLYNKIKKYKANL